MLIRMLARRASPGGARGRLSILIFHRVAAQIDPLFPEEMDAARFEQVCTWLRGGFNVLALDDAVRRLAEGTLPERALAITFDDGYADNHDVALPILARHGLPATFFIATGFLDGGRMWNDTLIESLRRAPGAEVDLSDVDGLALGRHSLDGPAARRSGVDALLGQIKYLPVERRQRVVDLIAMRTGAALPNDLMMTSEQVQQLRRAGMQIGAHTVSHPILAKLDRAAATQEIDASKRRLELLLGERVGLFAYPNGKPGTDYNAESVSIARELGFDAAVSTAWGAADRRTDAFQIPRFTPWDRSRFFFGARLVQNLRRPQANVTA